MEALCKIRDIYRTIAEYETAFVKHHHLCLNEGMLLCSLSKSERLSSGEIAGMLGLSASNASKVIKSVETKGCIGRVMGMSDKRQMYFSLTDEGRKRLEAIKSEPVAIPRILQNLIENSVWNQVEK